MFNPSKSTVPKSRFGKPRARSWAHDGQLFPYGFIEALPTMWGSEILCSGKLAEVCPSKELRRRNAISEIAVAFSDSSHMT